MPPLAFYGILPQLIHCPANQHGPLYPVLSCHSPILPQESAMGMSRRGDSHDSALFQFRKAGGQEGSATGGRASCTSRISSMVKKVFSAQSKGSRSAAFCCRRLLLRIVISVPPYLQAGKTGFREPADRASRFARRFGVNGGSRPFFTAFNKEAFPYRNSFPVRSLLFKNGT